MGNPSEQVKHKGPDLVLTLTNSPLYILPAGGASAQFRALLQRALLQSAKVTQGG
jgi:hypothetical protein